MKRLLSWICILVLVVCIHTNVIAAPTTTPSITIGNVTVESGKSIDIPISLANNNGICGATLTISYDKALVLEDVKTGNAFTSMTMTKPGNLSANPVKLVWDSMEADRTNGNIAVLTLKAPSKPGTYSISAQYDAGDIVNGDLEPVDVIIINGTVTVTQTPTANFEMTGISVTAYNKLTIRWPMYEGADGYLIYKQGSDGKYTILKNVTSGDTTSYTTTVTSGVKYTYKVAAYQLSGNQKVILAESPAKSQTALPAAPKMTNADMAAYNKIRLQWTKVSGCEGYVIYRSTSENGTYKTLKSLAEPATVAYVNVVTESEDYYYKMRAYVTVNGTKVYGNYSNVIMGNVISGPPANFAVKQVNDTKIKFTWDKVDDADGYVIYMATEKDGTYKAIKNITDNNTLTYSKNVTAGQTYYFYMKAYRNGVEKKVYSETTEVFSNQGNQ